MGKSNGQVIDDVTWPRRVKSRPQYAWPNISKTAGNAI